MPGLPFENLPATQQIEEPMRQETQMQDPIQRMENQFNQQRQYLHRQWQVDAEAIDNTWFADRGKWQTAVAKLTAKYKIKELELQQVRDTQIQEQRKRQQYVMGFRYRKKAPTDIELYQAQQRLDPQEERFAGLPVEGKPLSPAQLASPSMKETRNAFIEDAPTIKKWHLRRKDEPKTGQGLLDAYAQWRNFIQYDEYGTIAQGQWDQVWDLKMLADDRFKAWQSDKVQTDLRALRSRGRIADVMKEKIVGKPPIERSFEAITARQKRAQYFKGIRGTKEPAAQIQQQPRIIRQRNRRTGQERISYDGGKTWQTTG